jgi:hypothetical protein
MTRDFYISRAKRILFLGNLIFIVVGGGLVVAMAVWVGRGDGWVHALRDKLSLHVHPNIVGVVAVLPVIPILVSPVVLALVLIHLLDRRIGLRCPHCARSLTLRCRYRIVARTGECQLCHGSLFDGESA